MASNAEVREELSSGTGAGAGAGANPDSPVSPGGGPVAVGATGGCTTAYVDMGTARGTVGGADSKGSCGTAIDDGLAGTLGCSVQGAGTPADGVAKNGAGSGSVSTAAIPNDDSRREDVTEGTEGAEAAAAGTAAAAG